MEESKPLPRTLLRGFWIVFPAPPGNLWVGAGSLPEGLLNELTSGSCPALMPRHPAGEPAFRQAVRTSWQNGQLLARHPTPPHPIPVAVPPSRSARKLPRLLLHADSDPR